MIQIQRNVEFQWKLTIIVNERSSSITRRNLSSKCAQGKVPKRLGGLRSGDFLCRYTFIKIIPKFQMVLKWDIYQHIARIQMQRGTQISKSGLSKYGLGCQNADAEVQNMVQMHLHCAKNASAWCNCRHQAIHTFSALARVCLCIGVWYEDWWGDLS